MSDFTVVPEWRNPAVFGVNRLPAHTRWGAYDSGDNARAAVHGASPFLQSLNGEYRFRVYPNPDAVDDFHRPDYDDAAFATLDVPANWEVAGFDQPRYTNWIYPWSLDTDEPHALQARAGQPKVPHPPHVPSDNPTGCYRRRFDVPAAWNGRDVFLRFEGVETAFYVWVNGRPVGYAQDSKLPVEFRVTDFLVPGENLLALQVIRFAAGSYLEDQDYWHLSGVYRDVGLVSKPVRRIDDWQITALPDADPGVGGDFAVDVHVARVPRFADGRVRVAVFGPDGRERARGESEIQPAAQYTQTDLPTAAAARVRLRLDRVERWSPETPFLYTAVLTLLDPDGRAVDFEACRFGFKRIEVKDGVVFLNGQRLVVHGVNRHEHAPRAGRAVTREHMREEIRQMKRMNVNSVRTCHYPDSPDWYDLCDELGLLLVCECDVETHGVAGQLSHDPAWAGAYLDRAVRMVGFYKNHASIYSWSLGNESGYGANHAAMYGFIKQYDPTRLCQYEAGNPPANISDVRGWMYASPENILAMLTDPRDARPVILVEYLYQIRNSGGGLEHFPRLLERHPRFQGGYVWDWQDKCLVQKTADGREFFAYGGDFNERFIEQREPLHMVANGVVAADLAWKPVAHELKQAYCPVRLERLADGLTPAPDLLAANDLRIKRLQGDIPCDCLALLREDGRVIAERAVPLPAYREAVMPLPVDFPHTRRAGHEYTLEFIIRRRNAAWYCEKGYELGRYQFPLAPAATTPAAASPAARGTAPEVAETADGWRVVAGDTLATFARRGGLATLENAGVVYLRQGPTPTLNRPFTGLDTQKGWGWFDVFAVARRATLAWSDDPRCLVGGGRVRLEFDFRLEGGPDAAAGVLAYTLREAGKIDAEFRLELGQGWTTTPRVGVALTVPAGFERLDYFGYGPGENYVDRRLSAYLAAFSTTVAAQHFPFVPPSECGGHEETRWLRLVNGDGAALRVRGARPFHFDARHATVADYLAATHDHELPRRPETTLHLDAAHAPIGDRMAWSTVLPPELALRPGGYYLAFTLETTPPGTTPDSEAP